MPKEDISKNNSGSNKKRCKNILKIFLIAFILVFIIVSSYISLPLLTLYNLNNSIQEKNFEKFSKNIDHKSLQKSIKSQIYQHINNKENDSFKKIIARNFAKSYVDKAIEEATTNQNLFYIITGKEKEKEKFLWGLFDFLKVIKKIDFLGVFNSFKILQKLDFLNIFTKEEIKEKTNTEVKNIKIGFEKHNRFFLKFSKDKNNFKIILTRHKFSWKVSEIILPKKIFQEKI